MKVNLFGVEQEISNDQREWERIFGQISDRMKQSDELLVMIVDDAEVTEDHYHYVYSRLAEISEIVVGAKTFGAIAVETLQLAEHYLERAIPSLRELTQEFYANPNTVSWAELEQLFEGLQWLVQMAEGLNRKKHACYDRVIDRIQSFNHIIPEMEQALEEKDHTLIADVLNYDILQQLISLKHDIKQFMDNEVAAHDIG